MEYIGSERLSHMGDLTRMAAQRYGDKRAIVFQDEGTSFAEIEAGANRVANLLVETGVDPGERVGLFVPTTDWFPTVYFGALKAGAIPVPLNLRMDPETLAFVVDDADMDVLFGSVWLADEVADLAAATGVSRTYVPGGSGEGIVDFVEAVDGLPEGFDRVEAGVDRDDDDVAVQPYTSGTTGQPKGVMLTHENLLSTLATLDGGGIPIDADDTVLIVLPLFHIYGLNALMGSALYSGIEMIFHAEPDAQAMLSDMDEYGVTFYPGVPALFTELFREYREDPEAYDLSALELTFCGASPLADSTRREITEAWDVPMVEGWGMTETAPSGCIEPAFGVKKAAGCVGPPMGGIEIKLVDPETGETKVAPDQLHPEPDPDVDFDDRAAVTGEIAIRGPNVFEGYYNRPEKTEAAFDDEGYFLTKDIARVDADGYFWIVDRADDMIIAGGENIYPAEVEDALYEHPDVAEAAVVAAPHEVKGEAPVAFVVLEAGADVTERELREFSLDHVATYAHPRRVFFVEDLPRSATQKVQRFKLETDAHDRLGGPLEPTDEEL